MKHFRLFPALVLFAFFFIVGACSEQPNIDPGVTLDTNEANIAALTRGETQKTEYMPLNVIPDWAKQKMTQDEYALWTLMSSMYEIDYSFLQNELDVQQKEILYNEVRNICQQIVSGKIKEPSGYFTVYNPSDDIYNNIEQLTRSEMPDQGTFAIGPKAVYSVTARDAYVMVTAICVVKDKNVVAAGEAKAYETGRDAFSYNGSAVVSSFGSNSVTISCAGTLRYYMYDAWSPSQHGRIESVDFNSSVTIVLFP